MLAWRIPWAFACTGCQVLLADTCPDCGRRHRSTRPGRPRQPGRCDLTGLPLPPWRPPGGTPACASDPAATPAVALPAGGHVLAAQQHVDAVIAALLVRARPAGRDSRPAAVPGRRLRGRPRRRLSRRPHSRLPRRRHRGPGRARRADRRPTQRVRQPAPRDLPGSSRPSPRSASPSPTSCCTAGPATPTPSSPPGSPPTPPAAAR